MNPGQKTEVGDQEEKVMRIDSAKDLEVYKKEYSLAMEIFEISKTFVLKSIKG